MRVGFDYPGMAVVFFCHDRDGNFLMQKRGENAKDENGRWDIGSGGVEFGHNLLYTLKKEIKEEYSTDILKCEPLGYRELFREHQGERTHWVGFDYKVLVDKSKVRNGEPHKFDDIGWFTLDNLPSPLHSQFPNFVKKYGNRLT